MEIKYQWFEVKYNAKGYIDDKGVLNIPLPKASEDLLIDTVEIKEIDLTKE